MSRARTGTARPPDRAGEKAHFPGLLARYDADFAGRLSKCRLQRISKAVERFLGCGDYRRGVARIRCTNPRCRAEYFRPFSRSVFHPLVGPPHRTAAVHVFQTAGAGLTKKGYEVDPLICSRCRSPRLPGLIA